MSRSAHWAITLAVAAVSGGLAGAVVQYLTESRSQDIRLVEIGIGILRADPKEDVTPARDWAIRIIEKYSDTEFSPDDRAKLLKRPIEGNWWSIPFVPGEDPVAFLKRLSEKNASDDEKFRRRLEDLLKKNEH